MASKQKIHRLPSLVPTTVRVVKDGIKGKKQSRGRSTGSIGAHGKS